MHGRPPLLSIVTVTRNDAHLLESTIHSVLEQTYPHIEYLLLDRGSTDHTSIILKLAERTNQRLISGKLLRILTEPDNGLTDAMNRGQRTASGDFLLFLPPGDRLFERQTVEKIMRKAAPETDVLFGETMLVSPTRRHLGTLSEMNGGLLPKKLTADGFRIRNAVAMPAFVTRRATAPDFATDHPTAKLDWMISILKKSRQTVGTGLVLSEAIRQNTAPPPLQAQYSLRKKHFGFWPSLWATVGMAWREFWGGLKNY